MPSGLYSPNFCCICQWRITYNLSVSNRLCTYHLRTSWDILVPFLRQVSNLNPNYCTLIQCFSPMKVTDLDHVLPFKAYAPVGCLLQPHSEGLGKVRTVFKEVIQWRMVRPRAGIPPSQCLEELKCMAAADLLRKLLFLKWALADPAGHCF